MESVGKASRNRRVAGRTGVVLVGGGARGAYEAGALSVLLPALEERGQRPTVFVGTSAGAINAVLFASFGHLPAKRAADEALELWRTGVREQVIRPVVPSALRAGARYLAGLAGLPARLQGLLDPAPLRRVAAGRLDWERLHDNTSGPDAPVDAVAVVTTSHPAGRSVVFVEGPAAGDLPGSDAGRALDYRETRLTADHVMASAAIPVAFPPVPVVHPDTGRVWYLDGGIRLNAPVKPAVALNVDRVLIVATEPAVVPDTAGPAAPAGPPDVYDAAAQVLRTILNDQLIEDVRTLGKLNKMIHAYEQLADGDELRSADGRPYRVVPYLVAAPSVPGRLGELATEVFRERYGGLRVLRRRPDIPLLSLLLGGRGRSHGELLSYLFFDGAFIDAAIEAGREDAQRMLDDRGEGIWDDGAADDRSMA